MLSRDQQIDHILEEIAKKRSLSAICREDRDMPSVSGFLGWVAKDDSLKERYACAREAQITETLEEILDIADDATDDAYISNGVAKINGRAIRRAQLMIEARERFAKMMLPERFNMQRTDVTSGGKALPAPVTHNDNRIQALLVLAAERAKQLTPPLIDARPIDPLDDIMA